MTSRLYALYHELATFLKRNEKVEAITRIIGTPLFLFWMLQDYLALRKRRNGYQDPRFMWIKDLKGKYEGKRCFVLGAGPSLTFNDLDAISDEYSFGVNGCILSFDKTKWRPTFYGIEDKYPYESLAEHIAKCTDLDVMVSTDIAETFTIPSWFKVFPQNLLDHRLYHRNDCGKIMFSDDCYNVVYSVYSIVFIMMQFAVYMGFKEIYLLGCDCDYGQPKKHFIEFSHRHKIKTLESERVIYVHGEFKKFADSHGVKVVNCTRGGKLEVYPRMALEDVLAH